MGQWKLMAKTPGILNVWQRFPYQDLYVILLQLEPTEVKLWRLCLDQTVAFQFGIYFCEGNKNIFFNVIAGSCWNAGFSNLQRRFSVHQVGLNQNNRGSN